MADNEDVNQTEGNTFFDFKRDPLWKSAAKGTGMLLLSPLVGTYFLCAWLYESGPQMLLWLLQAACDWGGWLLERTVLAVWRVFVGLLRGVGGFFERYVVRVVRGVWELVGTAFERLWGWVCAVGEKIWDVVVSVLGYASDLVLAVIEWITDKIWSGFSWLVTSIFKAIEAIYNVLCVIVEWNVRIMKKIADAIWGFLTGWVWRILVEIWDVIISLLQALRVVIQDLISGLSWILVRTGDYIMAGLAWIWNMIVRAAHAIWSPITSLFLATLRFMNQIWDLLIKGLSWILDHTFNALSKMTDLLIQASISLWSFLVTIASIVWSPLSSIMGWIRRKTSDLVSLLLDWANEFFWAVVDISSQLYAFALRVTRTLWRLISESAAYIADRVACICVRTYRLVTTFCCWVWDQAAAAVCWVAATIWPVFIRGCRTVWRLVEAAGSAVWRAGAAVVGGLERAVVGVWRFVLAVVEIVVGACCAVGRWIGRKWDFVKGGLLFVWNVVIRYSLKSWTCLRSIIIQYLIQPVKTIYSSTKKACIWIGLLTWDFIKKIFSAIKEWYFATSTFFVSLKSYIVKIFKILAHPFIICYKALKNAVISIKDMIKTGLKILGRLAKDYLIQPFYICGREVKRLFLAIYRALKDNLKLLVRLTREGLSTAKNWLRDVFLRPIVAIIGTFRELFRGFRDFFRGSALWIRQNVTSLKESIRRGFIQIKLAARSFATQTKDAFRAALRQLRAMVIG